MAEEAGHSVPTYYSPLLTKKYGWPVRLADPYTDHKKQTKLVFFFYFFFAILNATTQNG